MAIISLRCPSCGASLGVEDTSESWFCQYCGIKIIQDKQYIELSGKVAVSGIASTDSLLDRAFLFIEDGNFQKAFQYMERVLDADPKSWKAYIGNLLCQLKLRKIEDLENSVKLLTSYDNYNKAIRFAVGNDASMLKALNNVIIKRIEHEKIIYEGKIANLQKEIASTEQYLNDNRKYYNHCVARKVTWTVFEVFCILLSVFLIIGTIAVLPILILSVPAVIGTVFVIIKRNKIKKLMVEYINKKPHLTQLYDQLSQERQAYSYYITNQ